MTLLVSIDAVMTRLGICRKTAMRVVATGKLPALKVGRQWRFKPEDIDAFVERQREEQMKEFETADEMTAAVRRAARNLVRRRAPGPQRPGADRYVRG